MSEKDNEKHEESTKLTADHIKGRDLSSDSEEEMDPGRVLEAGELNLEVLEGSDEEATETLEKILEKPKQKKVTKKTKAKKITLEPSRWPKPIAKPKPKTVTVRYDGLLQMGSENPTRMWKRGDTMKVSPEIAERLTKHRDWTIVKRKKR